MSVSEREHQPGARPPTTRLEPVTDVLHGHAITDPYRWLEGDIADPADMGRLTSEVAAWTETQNDHTRRLLDGLPGRAAVEQRLRPLMEVGSVSAPRVRGERYFHARREGDQDQAVTYWRDGLHGEDHVLVDPQVLDPSGLTTVEWTSPSRDGRLLAYGTYRVGDENTTLNLLEVDSGRLLPLRIPHKVQPPQWLPDDSGFVYRNLRDPNDPYSGQVMFHRMGSEPEADLLLFRQLRRDEDQALATTWGPFGQLSHDGRWLLLGYWTGTSANDLYLADLGQALSTGQVDRRPLSVGSEGKVMGTVVDDRLYLYTTKGAPNGRVVVAGLDAPEEADWRDLVPERSDAVIQSMAIGRDRLVLTYLKDASNVTEVFDMQGRPLGVLRQPGIGSTSLVVEQDSSEAYLGFESFHHPYSVFRVDLQQPEAEPEPWARPEAPVDPSQVHVEQVWYPSKDGTMVSMFLVHRKGLVRDGSTPTLLNGYGGFNVSRLPAFQPQLFHWFEEGGLYALPNLRGGGEYGEAWHKAGMLERKQNVFDDFIAAAEWLIDQGITRPEKLAISGGSNGGLLTGAALTQRPDLFRVAMVLVPLLDMLRYQSFSMARYWVPEYGSAEDPAQLPFLLAYSPYHRVQHGTAYPAVFLTAGEHDSRVHAMHARKMAAALQAATSADPAERPVLLWVDREAGHGQGKPLHLRLRDAVDQRLFTMWQLGMIQGQLS